MSQGLPHLINPCHFFFNFFLHVLNIVLLMLWNISHYCAAFVPQMPPVEQKPSLKFFLSKTWHKKPCIYIVVHLVETDLKVLSVLCGFFFPHNKKENFKVELLTNSFAILIIYIPKTEQSYHLVTLRKALKKPLKLLLELNKTFSHKLFVSSVPQKLSA